MKDTVENTSGDQTNEPLPAYGFVHISEDEKLLRDALLSDVEKLQLFSKMLYRNAMLKKAKVISR